MLRFFCEKEMGQCDPLMASGVSVGLRFLKGGNQETHYGMGFAREWTKGNSRKVEWVRMTLPYAA